jgi:hypothetical protein
MHERSPRHFALSASSNLRLPAQAQYTIDLAAMLTNEAFELSMRNCFVELGFNNYVAKSKRQIVWPR